MILPVRVEDVNREVKILRALSGHENVVQFHNAFEDDYYVYIAMEARPSDQHDFSPLELRFFISARQSITTNPPSSHDFAWKLIHWRINRTKIIMEYLVNISKRRAFWSLNEDILKINILTTNTPYPSEKIRRIHACTHQRPQRKHDQYAVSRRPIRRIRDICMTRILTNELFTPFKDPEREFRSSKRHFKTLSLDELRSPDFNLFSDQEYSEEEVAETMAEI
ncbi:ribonuclease H-like domain-containing protein [Tanacetum coccineum]